MTFIEDQFLKIDQVCEILQISRSQFLKLRKQGEYTPTVFIGESPRWSAIELQELLQPKTKKE
jgi:predicted DNA-binding transcriptional regulator AlpA